MYGILKIKYKNIKIALIDIIKENLENKVEVKFLRK